MSILDSAFGLRAIFAQGVGRKFRNRWNFGAGFTITDEVDENNKPRTKVEFNPGDITGTGDVVGPATATDLVIAVFDGITGKLIKAGTQTIAQLQAATAAALAAANAAAALAIVFKLDVVVVNTSTLTLVRATHAGKYLRFTHASGCVVTLNNDVFEGGDWLLMRATQAAAVSFTGSLTPTTPASKAATSAEAGATLAAVFSSASAADLFGHLSDA